MRHTARLFILYLLSLPLVVSGQGSLAFQDSTWVLSGIVSYAPGQSADFDNDGDLDLAFVGGTNAVGYFNYGNGQFANGVPFLPAMNYAYDNMLFQRADIDSDGDVDVVALEGSSYNRGRFVVLRNDGGVFTVQFQTDWVLGTSNLQVVDMNNDGRSDLLYSHGTGDSHGNPDIYRLLLQAVDGTFADSGYEFHPQGGPDYAGIVQVGDIDGDGFLDVLFSGNSSSAGYPAELFRNLKGRSFERKGSLPTLKNPFFVDYNGDGKLDLAQVMGNTLKILEGQGNFTFSNPKEIPFNFYVTPRIEIADVDFNGWPDLLISQSRIELLLNTGSGSYVDFGTLTGTYEMTAFLTDIENDGDLDIANGAHIHKNIIANSNTPPSIPVNLQLSKAGNEAVFSWASSSDNNTPPAFISYNLWVKDAQGKSWLHPVTDPAGSVRRLVGPGNVGYRTSYTLNDLPAGDYTARVQAVDASFALSGWSNELTFSIMEGPSNLEVTRLLLNKVRLTWDDLAGEEGYVVERSSETSAYTIIADLPANATEFIDDNLPYNNRFTYRVQARKGGLLSASSNTSEWDTQLFVAEDSTFPNVIGSLDVGDFNADGRTDVLLFGSRIANGQTTDIVSSIFVNTPAGWINQPVGEAVSSIGDVKFLDINGDHRIDVFKYHFHNGAYRTEIFQNNPDFTFTPLSNYFSIYTRNIREGWDFDMDNDLDPFVNYVSVHSYSSLLRKNSWSDYVPVPSLTTTICSWCSAQVTVGDFDADGDEDIIRAFQQNANFLHLNSPIGLRTTQWAFESPANQAIDFNGDGLLDVFSGAADSYGTSRLFKNVGVDTTGIPVLSLIPISFPENNGPSSGYWADFDHDGDLDLLFASGKGPYYNNEGNGQFVRSWLGFRVYAGARLIDFDSDGDMDLLSPNAYGEPYLKLFVNQLINGGGITNTPPAVPTNLVAVQDTTGVHLRWDAPADDHTRPEAITYDVALFQSGVEYSASVFDPVTGQRPKLSHGRILHQLTLNNLTPGMEYTWKVQAVDQSFAGSAVSAAASFTPIPFAPLVNDTTVMYCQFTYDPKNPVITAGGENIEWFSDKLATNRIATGPTYAPRWSQTVFVRQTVGGVAGIVKSVTIVVKDCYDRIITSVEEAGPDGIAVYPSPARESFTVSMGVADNASVTVYDLQGRLLLKKHVEDGVAELKVSVQGWPKGMYVVRVESNRGSTTTKIVLE